MEPPRQKETVVKIHKEGSRYVADSLFEERHLLKAARWRWDPDDRRWWTDDPQRAARLAGYADDGVRSELATLDQARRDVLAASAATDADVVIPVPEGLELLPFQKAGVAYAAKRTHVLIGDEMGLGKTIQAIALAGLMPAQARILVICPASLRLNWKREWQKWDVHGRSVEVAGRKGWPACQVVILNYDVVTKYAAELRASEWDLVVCDEAHYMKNPKARRTQMVLGHEAKDPQASVDRIPAKRGVFLTGTPILNRPIELWTLVNVLDPAGLGRSFFGFAARYCGACHNGYGWDFSGASNLEELQERLRLAGMVRRLKSEVLAELPPKRRQVIELAANGAEALVSRQNELSARYEKRMEELEAAVELAKAGTDEEWEQALRALNEGRGAAFAEMAETALALGVAKVPHVIEFIEETLGEQEKVVIFAQHHKVIDALMDAFAQSAVRLRGDDSLEARQRAVDRFQSDPTCTVFVGSIHAAGVGITLTAASRVLFAELDWVPANLSQAEDRLHRIGQSNSVLVQHLVFDNSLDARMAHAIVAKQDVIDRALNREALIEQEIRSEQEAKRLAQVAATTTLKREHVQKLAEQLALRPEGVEAIHLGLQLMAGVCDGARQLDGMGFNKIDTRIGKQLAAQPGLSPRQAILGRQVLIKYRRQLPSDLHQLIVDAVKRDESPKESPA